MKAKMKRLKVVFTRPDMRIDTGLAFPRELAILKKGCFFSHCTSIQSPEIDEYCAHMTQDRRLAYKLLLS